jgi:peptidoglycan/LPS O-acetylase OafA/YrhL
MTATSADHIASPVPAISVLQPEMPGIDLLRGVAILMVVLFHGFQYSSPELALRNPLASLLFRATGYGWTGVNLFFSLSGFLITGNLLDSVHRENFYARFYIRRALRILPLYFAILLVLGWTHAATWNYLAVCAIFLANWPKLLLHGSIVLYGPLWSLAVEEQFYIAWPWLCRRMQRHWFLIFCAAIVILCPVLRMTTILMRGPNTQMYAKTFLIGDNLAVGAIIAILCRSSWLSSRSFLRLGVSLMVVCSAVLVLLTTHGHTMKGDALGGSLGYSALEGLSGGVLILMLYAYRRRQIQPTLRFLVFFADISYGLYLIHVLIADLYDRFYGEGYKLEPRALLIRFAATTICSVLLALLSKRYFEKPVLNLKFRIKLAG